jgi:hypothetical protein
MDMKATVKDDGMMVVKVERDLKGVGIGDEGEGDDQPGGKKMTPRERTWFNFGQGKIGSYYGSPLGRPFFLLLCQRKYPLTIDDAKLKKYIISIGWIARAPRLSI